MAADARAKCIVPQTSRCSSGVVPLLPRSDHTNPAMLQSMPIREYFDANRAKTPGPLWAETGGPLWAETGGPLWSENEWPPIGRKRPAPYADNGWTTVGRRKQQATSSSMFP